MIKYKEKICKDCKEKKYIYARGLCQYCYRKMKAKEQSNRTKAKPKKNKRINPISNNQIKLLKQYRINRDEYMIDNPVCEAKASDKCQYRATDCHHKAGKSTNELYLSKNNFMAVCRRCHNYIHEHPRESYEKGFMIKNL